MASSFSALRATRNSSAWSLANHLAVSWAMEEVAPMIIIFMLVLPGDREGRPYIFHFVPPLAALCLTGRQDHPTPGRPQGCAPTMPTKRLDRLVHRRGDGLSSPWG